MKKINALVSLTLALMVSSSLSFASTLTSMNKAEVEQAFIDKTASSISMFYLNNAPTNNIFTSTLDKQGNIMAKLAHKPTNGPQTDSGIYKLNDDGTMYVTWQHWNDAKEVCLRAYNTQEAYIIVNCAGVFQTAFLKNAIQSGDQLNMHK